MSSSEHIPSSAPTQGACTVLALPASSHVFDILNIFRQHWFLSRTNLLANAISAQKAEDGNISWVEFPPPFHSHLVNFSMELAVVPSSTSRRAGCKANNAQKEKRRLTWKQSRAAKRERDRETVKAAKLPEHVWQCMVCGRKFNSCKTTSRHKCPVPKGASVGKEADKVPVTQIIPTSKPIKPAALTTPHVPPTPTNNDLLPPVTGDSWEQHIPTELKDHQDLWMLVRIKETHGGGELEGEHERREGSAGRKRQQQLTPASSNIITRISLTNSVWKSSLKTEKRPRLNWTGTNLDWKILRPIKTANCGPVSVLCFKVQSIGPEKDRDPTGPDRCATGPSVAVA
ncbi:hypothetical protein EDB89DRAFT_1907319 [Lactarius sanguifluus]|nr:hypothetical protein EDB89DRAFT_1907319 [Lactarius sanguifluus]